LSTELVETSPLFIESLDFNFGLFHQGPNGAVITYFSPDPAPWPTDWTRWLLSQGRVEAGGDFNFGLYHQGPNGAVIKYFSLDPAPWPTDWTPWLLSQGRVEAAAVFKNSGGNINMAPGLPDLTLWLLSSQGTGGQYYSWFETTALSTRKASSDMASANAVETDSGLSHDQAQRLELH
jgi:hypothetical protein